MKKYKITLQPTTVEVMAEDEAPARASFFRQWATLASVQTSLVEEVDEAAVKAEMASRRKKIEDLLGVKLRFPKNSQGGLEPMPTPNLSWHRVEKLSEWGLVDDSSMCWKTLRAMASNRGLPVMAQGDISPENLFLELHSLCMYLTEESGKLTIFLDITRDCPGGYTSSHVAGVAGILVAHY